MNKKPWTPNGGKQLSGNVVPQFDGANGLGQIQNQLMGIGAGISGENYAAYRVGPNSSGDVIQPSNQLCGCFPIWRELLSGKKALQAFETTKTQDIYFFELSGDFGCSLVGDTFITQDPGKTQVAYNSAQSPNGMPAPQLNGFGLVIDANLRNPIGARVDRTIQVYRVATTSVDGYLDTTLQGANPIVLQDGRFQLGTGTFSNPGNQPACRLPAGLLPVRKSKGAGLPGSPDTPPKSQYSCYTIPMRGFTVVPGDIVVDSYGECYRVQNSFHQDVGAVGNFWTLESEVSAIGYPL